MCDSTDLSREESKKCHSKKSLTFSQRFYRIMSSKKMNALSDKIRGELCLSNVSQNRQSFSDCLLKKFESKEDNYRRDSFCDRFCDDLCEDILQYLSLEDKLRLECVSKQFQRTVFKRQNELYIHMSFEEQKMYFKNNQEISICGVYDCHYIEDQSLYSFKALLNKCPNITSIQMNGSNRCRCCVVESEKVNHLFRFIIENCSKLSEVYVLNQLNGSNFEELHEKFGLKVKYLRFYRQLIDLNRFPNIEKLEISYGLRDESIIPQLELPNLKKLDIELELDEVLFQRFINKFQKLTHLNVKSFLSDDENTFYKPLKNISNLKHLIHFKIQNQTDKSNKFCGLLKQMANICENLKSINCCFHINQNSDLREFLFQLKAFPLKRLNLRLRANKKIRRKNNIDVNKLFSFELFEGLSNITHLSLCFDQTLDESILKDIDINLPNIQYLEIEYRFFTTPEGVTQMADILSRLSRLETLKLKFKSGVDFKPIKEQGH